MAKTSSRSKKSTSRISFHFSRQFIVFAGLLLGLGVLLVSLFAVSQNTEDRSKAAESRKVYSSWEFNTSNTNEGWMTDPARPTHISGGHLFFELASNQSRIQLKNSSLQSSIPSGQKYVAIRLAIGNFDQDVLGVTNDAQHTISGGFATLSSSTSNKNMSRFCAPRPKCLDNGSCRLLSKIPGWCNPTPSIAHRPPITPPAGCYYKQVQCNKAPCEPILVCPPTDTDCLPRPACLDAKPPCRINLPPDKKLCPTTPTPKPTCRPLPACIYENPPCSLVAGYLDNSVTWCPPTKPEKLSMVVKYQVGTNEMVQSMPSIEVVADGQYHEYRVKLGQLQDIDIRYLGFEFPKVSVSKAFAVDWIRIEGIPIPMTGVPTTYCKTGLNLFAVGKQCLRNDSDVPTFTSATYECHDGTKGTVSVSTCVASRKLSDMAKKKCEGHSSCVKPTPVSYYCDNGQKCPNGYTCITPGPCPTGNDERPSACAFQPYCISTLHINPTVRIKDNRACIQVITFARNTKTGECRTFSTPCDVPAGWVEDSGCKASTY